MFLPVSGADPFPECLNGGVVAIGNFDGVHRGHQAVIAAAVEMAQQQNRPALALTFDPHPRRFFQGSAPLFILSPVADKMLLLEATGLDGVMVQAFDADFAGMSAADFVARLLKDRLKAAHVVAGHDFHFGKGRTGTPAFLQDAAEEQGVGVMLLNALSEENATPISSSRIRAALSEGDIATANALFGYRWFVTGEVVHGDKRGRVLGFPTANLVMPQDFALKHGVYAARAFINGAWFCAAVHFGTRVQFGGGAPLLEAHLLDFNGEIYGQRLHVEFISALRGEQAFDSVDALVAQMGEDVSTTRRDVSKAVTQPQSQMQARLETLLPRHQE